MPDIHSPNLPSDPEKNTVGFALIDMMKACNVGQGFDNETKKGSPLCSGLGGSAASAVAAVDALNAVLESRLSQNELAKFATNAEALGSGVAHADNVVPCLWGSLL